MAVFTRVTKSDLLPFLAQFDIGELTQLTGIAEGVENTNYLIETDRGKFILTLFEKRVNEADLPFFLNYMAHLRKHGITVAEPMTSFSGELIHRLNGRAATIVTFLSGKSVMQPQAAHCAAFGELMADLHLSVADFPQARPNDLSLRGWQSLAVKCLPRANEVEHGLAQFIETELAYLKKHWPDENALPKGVIHADLFSDNVFFEEDKISGVIDFYFSCTDFYAYDLAISISCWCFNRDGSLDKTKLTALLRAYERKRRLSEAEKISLLLLLRGACLRFLLTRLHDWLHHDPNSLVTAKDPLDYAKKIATLRKADSETWFD